MRTPTRNSAGCSSLGGGLFTNCKRSLGLELGFRCCWRRSWWRKPNGGCAEQQATVSSEPQEPWLVSDPWRAGAMPPSDGPHSKEGQSSTAISAYVAMHAYMHRQYQHVCVRRQVPGTCAYTYILACLHVRMAPHTALHISSAIFVDVFLLGLGRWCWAGSGHLHVSGFCVFKSSKGIHIRRALSPGHSSSRKQHDTYVLQHHGSSVICVITLSHYALVTRI